MWAHSPNRTESRAWQPANKTREHGSAKGQQGPARFQRVPQAVGAPEGFTQKQPPSMPSAGKLSGGVPAGRDDLALRAAVTGDSGTVYIIRGRGCSAAFRPQLRPPGILQLDSRLVPANHGQPVQLLRKGQETYQGNGVSKQPISSLCI